MELVLEWLDAEDTKWELTRDVLEWARPYGTDLERAWNECPRADFLMALAGVGKADHEKITAVACKCAHPALAFVPRKEKRPWKALRLAESWRRGVELENVNEISDAGVAIFDELEAEEKEAHRAQLEQLPRVNAALRDIVAAAFDQAAPEATPSERVAAACAALIVGHGAHPALKPLRARHVKREKRLAFAHATRAATSCLTVAASADMLDRCMLLIGHEKRAGIGPGNAERVLRTAKIARRSWARVYTEAAHVFANAAGAHGRAQASRDDAWDASLVAYAGALAEAVLRGQPEEPDAPGETREEKGAVTPLDAMRALIKEVTDRATRTKLAEYADLVRAEIPYATLRWPDEEESEEAASEEELDGEWDDEGEEPDEKESLEEAMERDPRGTFRRALSRVLPTVRILDAPEVAEAIETAIAILDAPGALDRRALAPVMRTVHEHMATLFRRGARETTGEVRASLLEKAGQIEEDARDMTLWLEKTSKSELS